jgi:UDP-glucose 4-epimerase
VEGSVLVTGSSGHLGEALVRALRAAGRAVRGIDRQPSPYTDCVASIADRAALERAMRGARAVLHTATLHKPHVAAQPAQAFIDTNVTGTLALLEAAVQAGVGAFVYTSTTSAFGDALLPPAGAPAAWITEDVAPLPKNIYGVTKVAGEDLCALAHRNQGLACLVLRTSRFFPEADDDPLARDAYGDENLKLNELLYRRVDLEDVVSAHLCALERAPALGFGRYIVSATTPLRAEDAGELRRDAPAAVSRRVAGWEAVYARRGWQMARAIDRVYDNARARAALGWQPRHDFASALARVARGEALASPLARAVGSKGYGPESLPSAAAPGPPGS